MPYLPSRTGVAHAAGAGEAAARHDDVTTRGAAAEPVLKAVDLQKRFGGVIAVDGVSLSVHRSQIVGLIGPNGSGKTTTFNLIAGTTRSDGGRVYISGRDATRARPWKVAQLGLVRTFQLTRVFPEMTVLENLAVGRKRSQSASIPWDLLERTDLTSKLTDHAGDLSFGQQKIIELIRGLVLKPSIMLLDEPFAGLNPGTARELVAIIQYIRDMHEMAFLIIDHNLGLLMLMTSFVYVMSEGRVIALGTPADVQTDNATMEAYLGKRVAARSRDS